MLLEFPTGRVIGNVIPLFPNMSLEDCFASPRGGRAPAFMSGSPDKSEILTEQDIKEMGIEEAPKGIGPSNEELEEDED